MDEVLDENHIGDGVVRTLAADLLDSTRRLTWLLQAQAVMSVPAAYDRVLARLVEAPMRMSQVADVIGLSPPSASALVNRMEQDGFVRRVRGQDRRQVLVQATEVGVWLRTNRREDVLREIEVILRCMDAEERAALERGVRALRSAVSARSAQVAADS